MRNLILSTAVAAMALSMPLALHAQVVRGTENGAARGAEQGNDAAGPVGGIVGGAVGAGLGAATGAVGTATGVVGSIFGADDRPRFHDYVVHEHRRSYRWNGDVAVGAELPRSGVTFYDVPPDYHVDHRYRYAMINDRTVIVDPATHRIVDVID